jgi:cytochrome P450
MVSEGETWQRQHRMLRPGFAPRRVAGYAALMTDAAAAALDRTLQPHGEETEIELDLWTNAIAMDVILRTLFSTQLQPQRAKEITRAVQALDRHAMRELFWPVTLPDWLPLPGKAEKRWAVRTLKHFIAGHIAARQSAAPASAPQDDLLAMLLAARDEEGAEGDAALSAQEIHDQCQVIFLAGHETSATALQWWMLLMAKHRDALARAQQEIDETLQGQPPTADDAERLPWLMATIKEALRLYPPAPALMTRRAQADLPLETGTIPKGTLIFTLPWILQRDARWFPEPAAFKPERFLPDAPPLPRGAWMPFGTGPRVCIGQHLAMLELLLLTAMLLQRYDLQRPEGAAWPPAELHVTLRPPPGVRMKLIRR